MARNQNDQEKSHSRSLSSGAKDTGMEASAWPAEYNAWIDAYSDTEKSKWSFKLKSHFTKLVTQLCNPIAPLRQRKVKGNNKGVRIVMPNYTVVGSKSIRPNSAYKGNKVQTTKYNVFTFLPKNLFEQFHRLANLYFLFIAFLNWFPQIEAYGRFLGFIPLFIVLTVTAAKDAYEDRRRYLMDKTINNLTCNVYNGLSKAYVKTLWKDVTVGDIIRVYCNEVMPADILLLNSADRSGICYVETSSLDGENSLKPRQVVSSFAKRNEPFDPEKFRCLVECEAPNQHMYRFVGAILHQDGYREPLDKENLIIRGCELRNTDYIEGIVLYAGADTKTMLNSSKTRHKRSKLERKINSTIMLCVSILAFLCFIVSIGCLTWLNSFQNRNAVPFLNFFVDDQSSPLYNAFLMFWASAILFQIMIPISLYVTMELVKIGQVFTIGQDPQLYDKETHSKVECRTLNIPEELGQVEHILSDKTGTLTENLMVFKRCSVDGTDYANTEAENDEEGMSTTNARSGVKAVNPNPILKKAIDDIFLLSGEESLASFTLSADPEFIIHFFVNMALCNTVVVNGLPEGGAGQSIGKIMRHDHADKAAIENLPVALKTAWDTSDTVEDTDDNSARTSETVSRTLAQPSENATDKSNALRPWPYQWRNFISAKRIALLRRALYQPSGNESSPSPSQRKKTKTFLTRRSNFNLPPFSLKVADFFSRNGSDKQTSISLCERSGTAQSLKSKTQLDETSVKSKRASIAKPIYSLYNLPKQLVEMPKWSLFIPPLLRRGTDKPKTVSCFKNPIYEAESPDELALVHAAAAYGIRLAKRQRKQAFVQMPDRKVHAYDILHVLAFSPERRRMSVIVRQTPGNQLFLYCKGADATIMSLLSKKFSESRRGIYCINKTKAHLRKYSSLGLRTLCLAKRSITVNEYSAWLNQHHNAELAKKNRGELLEMSASMIERDLELLGATAVEDRLQPGVPECIQALRSAGINVWVLTGDKTETAVNIAYACNLFFPKDELLYIDSKNWLDADATLDACLEKTGLNRMSEETLKKKFYLNFGLVVDGRTLPGCIHPPLMTKFLKLISHCPAVLCTRSTPHQKAMVVQLVKKKLHSLTLAVGDGANDVPMLQSADVGVGISGKEGMHAVIASDFSMPRFKYLQRLLLVHGHWCYDRLARMVLYFFYKNTVMVFLMFFFQTMCGFSSQAVIDPVYQNLFNVIFTAMPPMTFGILEEDMKDKDLMTNPYLYVLGRKNQIFCLRKFALTLLDTLWQAAMIFISILMAGYGSDMNMCEISFLAMSCVNLCCQFHLLLETQKMALIVIVIFTLNLATFYGVSIIYNLLSVGCCNADPPYMVAQRMLREERYWSTVLLSVVAALLPRFVYRHFYSTVFSQKAQLAHWRFKEEHHEIVPSSSSMNDLRRRRCFNDSPCVR
uniref:Phospholipid-transporting ATPase n=1 Tax=Trichuris muris TaxID=70415 RepID=A0A5S6QGZ7_TRIMR